MTSLTHLSIANCVDISDDAFTRLSQLQHLVMAWPTQSPQLTDNVFVHLPALRIVDMSGASRFTDRAFAHLARARLHTLSMQYCDQSSITDLAFTHLPALLSLNITGCTQISDVAFAHLCRLHHLDISACPQITDVALRHLRAHGNLRSLISFPPSGRPNTINAASDNKYAAFIVVIRIILVAAIIVFVSRRSSPVGSCCVCPLLAQRN